MSNPRELVAKLESHPQLPEGSEERFSGYGVMGLPFLSGHILGLRRFSASSVGQGYTSVWHRDRDERWTFDQNVPLEQSCPRYFGSAITQARVADIEIDWSGPSTFSVKVRGDEEIDWLVSVRSGVQTRVMNAMGGLLPGGLWRRRGVLKIMGIMARAMLGAGNLGLTGRTPNGQQFMANPRLIWLAESSTASVSGDDLGPTGPLSTQARLGDFWIPQRGIFVVGGAFFEAFDAERHSSATSDAALG